ncbi:MAG: tetratricopeptide repeat protein [Cytophagales bacterium]|nr:tetratricopeptide repeat protein [Cytophagales bacterium]MCA6366250.1 tetratricopeptide repeat protein [Cytophagales bacterium]MCA6371933.1 tetratricopeptide repeat protein [Cytophagales bacterium]MCA6376641.1 tetratricopeptide repeat protein [Cytophagales bacterium]MCA6383681.1 tetratricopeptide repeat protein [Cytophagales bacterium]
MDNYRYKKFKNLIFNTILALLCAQLAIAQETQEIQIANEYLLRGEKNKALAAFQQLSKNPQNASSIHTSYFNLMVELGNFKQAEDYIEKLIRREDRLNYRLDLGILYLRSGDVTKADKYLKALIKTNADDAYKAKTISDYLASRNLVDYSIFALQQSRVAANNPHAFALELANLYRIQGKRDEMVGEYLDYVTQTPTNSGYIKNLMQLLLTKPEELESLENLLTDRVQKNQDSEVYSDLLIWTNLQSKNFYGAFIQARAYDKRFRKEQSKTLEIAQIALNNKDYKNADRAFLYVIKEFVNTPNFLPAQLGLIKTREAQVKNSFPVNKDSVRYLIKEFAQFRTRYPEHPSSFDARLSEALLYAYYLNELDSSVVVLNRLIADQKASGQLRNQSKVELGDIYLLKEEPWEATLLYSQVEKSQRETPLGYEAKLRNAKLSYYKGDFRLAQEHLDILKQATTREIANDALDLSMRIKENTAFDSTGAGLKEFAAIELLLAQNKMTEALTRLEKFQPKKNAWLTATELFELNYKGKILQSKDGLSLVEILDTKLASTIQDDVYWLEANIRMKQGQFDQAIALLEKIVKEYPEEILTDDAVFLKADIYERHLKDKNKAMEIYRDFLNKYPGSVYAAEARKRFRNLRGDFAEEKPIVN